MPTIVFCWNWTNLSLSLLLLKRGTEFELICFRGDPDIEDTQHQTQQGIQTSTNTDHSLSSSWVDGKIKNEHSNGPHFIDHTTSWWKSNGVIQTESETDAPGGTAVKPPGTLVHSHWSLLIKLKRTAHNHSVHTDSNSCVHWTAL